MGISPKNKRKFMFQDQLFYWWVLDEFGSDGGMLPVHLATADKSFLVEYFAIQDRRTSTYLTVIGNSFPGLNKKSGQRHRFACPDFIPQIREEGIRPKHIESILEWCFDESKALIPVNAKGEKLT